MADTIIRKEVKGKLVEVRMMMMDDPQNPGTQIQKFWGQPPMKNYVYIIKFQDDAQKIWEGEVSSKTPFHYKITAGSLMSCDIYNSDKSHNQTKFKEVKVIETGGNKVSSYNDPGNNRRMAKGMALTFAILTYQHLKSKPDPEEKLTAIANAFYNWITHARTIVDRDQLSRRWYALQNAIDYVCLVKAHSDYSTLSKTIFEYAEQFLAFAMSADTEGNS